MWSILLISLGQPGAKYFVLWRASASQSSPAVGKYLVAVGEPGSYHAHCPGWIGAVLLVFTSEVLSGISFSPVYCLLYSVNIFLHLVVVLNPKEGGGDCAPIP